MQKIALEREQKMIAKTDAKSTALAIDAMQIQLYRCCKMWKLCPVVNHEQERNMSRKSN